MVKLFRLIARVRYWKARALAAEARNVQLIVDNETELIRLREQMEAERWRNLSREDSFASAAVMGSRGMWGVPPRTGPAQTQRPPSVLEAVPAITGADRMEFETEWLPYALRNNITQQQAERDFLQELAKRKALHDEPMM